MSGLTINEALGEVQPNESELAYRGDSIDYSQPSASLWDFIKTPTGDGDLYEYQEHVLNWDGSKAVARILRGTTGLFGSLNFAVADILIGLMEITSKKGVKHGTEG